MEEIDLELDPNEASDLCPLFSGEQLGQLGWDRAYATVLDEAPAERALAVLGHRRDAAPRSGWTATRLKAKPERAKSKTEDAEACSRHGGWLVVLGSQFGHKDGPLDPRRSWMARVREDALADRLAGGRKPHLDVRRLRFGLHRAVNDAIAEAGIPLIGLGAHARAAYVDGTIALGARKRKRWAGAVRSQDYPINVEAAEFRVNGRLVLGLRHPVSADGDPILVEVDNLDAMFDRGEPPACSTVWVLEGAGGAEGPRGVRALHNRGNDEFDVVVGNLESSGKGSPLLQDLPAAGRAASAHLRFSLPLVAKGGSVTPEPARDFEGDTDRIEGIAGMNGLTLYVLDQEGQVALRMLRTGSASVGARA